MLKFDGGTGEFQNFIVEESAFRAHSLNGYEAIFCQGNGYLGQRAALEERYVGENRNLFVAATFDRFHESEVTELPNLPDLTNILICVDGTPFSMDKGELISFSRCLNLKTGELTRDVLWRSPCGKLMKLCFRRFVSMAREHVLGFRVDIACLDDDCSLTLESGIDGTATNSGTQHFFEQEKRLIKGRILLMTETTIQSGVAIRLHAANTYFVDGEEISVCRLPVMRRRYLGDISSFALHKGQALRLEKLCCVHTSRDLEVKDGLDDMQAALMLGYDALMIESAAVWAVLWDAADIKISSKSGYDQLAIRFAIYHLNIMVKKDDGRVGIGAKGLSGEGYKGHSFWDTEIFILPYFILTQPEVARTLLTYRYQTLNGARRKASDNGYRGAMYPWESAWMDDGEVTPLYGGADIVTGEQIPILTGQIEQHITADVAYAVWQYYTATGDREFMDRCGYEIIRETARFWASRATWDEALQAYVILNVIGPDEYKEHVDNNAYTNYMAYFNMQLALKYANDPEIAKVADGMYLPKPGSDGIIPQFDGYMDLKHVDLEKYKQSESVGDIFKDYNLTQINGMQVSKQADLVLLLLLSGGLFDQKTRRRNYLFYEERTLHDSSLSKSTHSVLAHDLGFDDTAYRYFLASCAIDLPKDEPKSDAGIHSASMGGIWQCTVYGFGGVRLRDGILHIAPRLPKEWEQLSFPLCYKGQKLCVAADKLGVTVIHRGSKEIDVNLYGKTHTLYPGREIRLGKEL
jgi:trehalose/maltose hydrolase-like predicted phosphorylase